MSGVLEGFIVWSEDRGREGAVKIDSVSASSAAEEFAERDDRESAEYDFAGGRGGRVMVLPAGAPPGAEPEAFTIEIVPRYIATRDS